MKYPVLLKLKDETVSVLCAEDIYSIHKKEKSTIQIHRVNGNINYCVESVEEVYQKIQDALNPENKALKQQNLQLIQELEKSNANLEAYKNEIDRLYERLKAFKGEIEDIRELIGANEDESAFDEVQRLHNKNISTYIAFAGFFEKTIDLIPNDLVVEVQKTLNELKP